MIIICHINNKIAKIICKESEQYLNNFVGLNLLSSFNEICLKKPKEFVIWCRMDFFNSLNVDKLYSIFHHNRIMASFNPLQGSYLPETIGYVEQSIFFNVNKTVQYPTWIMSSVVGGIHASVVNAIGHLVPQSNGFDYFLNSLAKRAMPQGLFCYSAPQLLKAVPQNKTEIEQANLSAVFKFVKQHYKWVWVYFLFFSLLIFEKRLAFYPLLRSFFYKKLKGNIDLETISVRSSRVLKGDRSIDVIIPTMGRAEYLYDVLKDLSKQTHLPKRVIIVEQNSDEQSESELNYLFNTPWPFEIDHTFIHQTGACNARNLALSKVKSEWVFLADDDIRFSEDLLESILNHLLDLGVKAGVTVCLKPDEIQTYNKTAQTSIFGSGSSMVKSELIHQIRFDTRYEFNYGEDTDFGMQLRNLGEDVVFLSDVRITHLKAPIGGFRSKVENPWDQDIIPPKPSPTIYLLKHTYFTQTQLLGYKLLLGIRTYKASPIKNPIKFVKYYRNQWQRSAFWSSQLTNKTDA